MPENLPYLVSPGTLATALQKIKAAATPERFTQDFLSTTLGMKGGSAKPIIPFLKRIGFLAPDGAPTELYRSYRNPSQSAAMLGQALRTGYKPLFDMNERAHELADADLKGLVVQATGHEEESRAVQFIVATFKVLKKDASSGATAIQVKKEDSKKPSTGAGTGEGGEETRDVGINLSYTINLNLPASPDVAVFNAIFRALRDNLLKK